MEQIIKHYDTLIMDGNDPFRDPPALKAYMDKWDGKPFIDALLLDNTKSVLEIGVGTGRLAAKTAPLCKKFVGIDLSPMTIERAKENLRHLSNISLICDNFCTYHFNEKFDVIYSSLTFMHFQDKEQAIDKIESLLMKDGRVVLSLEKNQQDYIEYGNSNIKIWPDNPSNICMILESKSMNIIDQFETDFAHIIIAKKAIY